MPISGNGRDRSTTAPFDDGGLVGPSPASTSNGDNEGFRNFLNVVYAPEGRAKQMQDRLDALERQNASNERRTKRMQDRLIALERQNASSDGTATKGGVDEGRALIGERFGSSTGVGGNDDDDAQPESRARARQTILQMEANYEMPESTYTWLTTEPVFSIPFFCALGTSAFTLMCLILAFNNTLDKADAGDDRNPLGMPAGVQRTVRTAQVCGILIGVLMEHEIPQGLELIGKAAEKDDKRFSRPHIVLPSLLRMATGYLFLLCMFLTVMQESTVLDIFFNVLALEFIENLDDLAFDLSKRGFLGPSLRVAANTEYTIKCGTEHHALRRWTMRSIHFLYFFNIALGFGALAYFAAAQESGAYRCSSVRIAFGDAIWEDAWVENAAGVREKRLLILSHFNGIYIEEKPDHDRRPRYVERNKEDGSKFKKTLPAEIVYCDDVEAWVFRHPDIYDEEEGDGKECGWVLRSPNTESFDITALAEEEEWDVWTGLVETDYKISIACNECNDNLDCNDNGECVEDENKMSTCQCTEEHFGSHCQFEQPCDVIRSEKDELATLRILDEEGVDFVQVYGRPMYLRRDMSGKPFSFLRLGYPDDDAEYFDTISIENNTPEYLARLSGHDAEHFNTSSINGSALTPHKHDTPEYFTDDDFFQQNNNTAAFAELLQNYTLRLIYTGRRWYGQMEPPNFATTGFEQEEFHAFWWNTFSGLGEQDNKTIIISAPTDGGTPVGVDFYEMRRRNIASKPGDLDHNYGPFGVLIPLTEYEGTGFFHCNQAD